MDKVDKESSPPTEYTFIPLNPQKLAVSSPELALKRRGSNNREVEAARHVEGTCTSASARRSVEPPVAAMESAAAHRVAAKPRSSKIGGFLSRFASFRFSTRKSDAKSKKKQQPEVDKTQPKAAQQVATKEDYIYIPLKGPIVNSSVNNRYNRGQESAAFITNLSSAESDDVNNKEMLIKSASGAYGGGKKEVSSLKVSGKPPLPKMPPRIVGACVKKRSEGHAQFDNESGGCRDIDSGAVPRNAASMEPMGLIETDLDTEVTVITSGAHVKTRSLMNLGVEAPPRRLAAAPVPARPHKSMEFLLDKQNLKVVEVSALFRFLKCFSCSSSCSSLCYYFFYWVMVFGFRTPCVGVALRALL